MSQLAEESVLGCLYHLASLQHTLCFKAEIYLISWTPREPISMHQ